MITSLSTSLLRVTLFWYLAGALVLFLGDPAWAESVYQRLMNYPWVPVIEMHGLATAAAVQWRLLVYWTVPITGVWLASLLLGVVVAEVQCQFGLYKQRANLTPRGSFWGVTVPGYSLGHLPEATTPRLTGARVVLAGSGADDVARVELQGAMREAVKMLTAAEQRLAEELIQLLLQAPDHFAGLGHGVGLLEHTLNVVALAAAKVTAEFRLPLLAALAHDVGKLITFQPDGKGGWKRKGLHSRESARILATLPAFQELPQLHQRALLLAVKYDHAPNKMPELGGEREANTLAMRTISALAQADRKATADEKERHLERLQPEDLLWQDFVNFLREAPVVQRGKKGAANQVNNPPDSPYLYLYEAPWRDAAVRRLPPEVAAALDLSRRDAGKMAKYTRILLERLRKEGLLVENYTQQSKDSPPQELKVSTNNPLWDIQSGTGEKAVVLRGIIVLKADDLWRKLNYRISVKSPFPVQILAPNADAEGRVNDAPRAQRDDSRLPDVSDGLKLEDVKDVGALAALGLTAEPGDESQGAKPKTRARGGFKPVASPKSSDDAMLGLTSSGDGAPARRPAEKAAPAEAQLTLPNLERHSQEAQEQAELAAALDALTAHSTEPTDAPASSAMNNALGYLLATGTQGDAGESSDSKPADGDEGSVLTEDLAPTNAPAPASESQAASGSKSGTTESSRPAAPERSAKPEVRQETPPVDGAELSRAEKREGLAIADAEAVNTYPGLKLGEKFYTAHSRAVQAGLKKPGSRYKGDAREKQLDLTDSGPRRGRRRIT